MARIAEVQDVAGRTRLGRLNGNWASEPYIRPGGPLRFMLTRAAIRAASLGMGNESPGNHPALGERSENIKVHYKQCAARERDTPRHSPARMFR